MLHYVLFGIFSREGYFIVTIRAFYVIAYFCIYFFKYIFSVPGFLVFTICMKTMLQFIGATMGSAELNIQTENGHINMPSNICCVIVEYLPGGALKSYLIKNRRRKLAFKVVHQLALDLARGYCTFYLLSSL